MIRVEQYDEFTTSWSKQKSLVNDGYWIKRVTMKIGENVSSSGPLQFKLMSLGVSRVRQRPSGTWPRIERHPHEKKQCFSNILYAWVLPDPRSHPRHAGESYFLNHFRSSYHDIEWCQDTRRRVKMIWCEWFRQFQEWMNWEDGGNVLWIVGLHRGTSEVILCSQVGLQSKMSISDYNREREKELEMDEE